MDSTIAIPAGPAADASGREATAQAGRGARQARDLGGRRRLGWLSVLVLSCLAGIAIATSLVTHAVVRDQEQRLLHERAVEVASVLSTDIQSLQGSLAMLARIAELSRYSQHQFASAASPLATKGVDVIGLARPAAGGFATVDAVGPGAAGARSLSAPEVALLRRASARRGLVSTIDSSPAGTRLDLALRGPGPVVVFEQSAIDPKRPLAAPPGSPYSELALRVYASRQPDPSQLVLTTTRRTLAAPVDHRLISVGADRWLLLASTRQPLVGSLASAMPWIVLVAGLVGALLATALVELLSRRRRYAVALVQERTTELQHALDRQQVLERQHREARDIAEKASRAKSEFLSRMSHELRTPLNAILGFGQLLELDELSDRQRENVKYILKGGGHLLELINEVLELARIESGQLALSPEPVLLDETLTETIALVQPLASTQGITLSADLSGLSSDTHVHADRQRLKQVLLNLLSNAIKYNRARGRVEVSATESGPGRVRVNVTDTGIGIDPQHLARVFEPFDRLGAESGEIEGTGLGLALSKRLVEAMGGSIAFESEPGHGTTFSLDLKTVDRPGLDLEVGPVEGPEARPGGEEDGCLILYIEDNLSNVTLVERILELEPGVELMPAMQARLGLDLARQHHPALIMLDLHLPDMGGEEVLRRLKSDPATSHIPVVVLSADASKGQIGRLLELGAVDYLTKPLVVQRFREVIEENLRVRGA